MWTNMFAIIYHHPTAVNDNTFFVSIHCISHSACMQMIHLFRVAAFFCLFLTTIFCFWLCWCNTHSEYDKQHKSCLPYLNKAILVSTAHDSSLVVNNAWEITMDVFLFDGQRATLNIKGKKKNNNNWVMLKDYSHKPNRKPERRLRWCVCSCY